MKARLSWPLEAVILYVEYDKFWLEDWGTRPTSDEAACAVARENIQAPTLIPLYGHRYLPDCPLLAGNPVFSVWETDTIYYGFDLPDYLAHEFEITNPYRQPSQPRRIAFWSSLPYLWHSDWD